MQLQRVLLLALLVAATGAVAEPREVFSAVFSSNTWSVVSGRQPHAVAVLEVHNTIATTGWASYHFETSPDASNLEQAYAMGFVEGAATSSLIAAMYALQCENAWGMTPTGPVPAPLAGWLEKNIAFVQEGAAGGGNSSFWAAAAVVLAQIQGLTDGYASSATAAECPLSFLQMYMLSAAGDLEDLVPLLTGTRTPFRFLDCSALIKPTADDVLFAHTTWRPYGLMLRAMRHYRLGLQGLNNRMVFSSSPGFTSSKDDWYLVEGHGVRLMVSETTLSVYNTSLYDVLTPASVLTFMRTMIANLVARDGREWTALAAEANSGTYCNQFMVVDAKRFEPGAPLANGLLWIIELLPGTVEAADVTSVLRTQGYWPSYNVAFFPRIAGLAGYPPGAYASAPRAHIFGAIEGAVTDAEAMQWAIQWNEWQTSPLSLGDPANAIASRYDLRTTHGAAFGGVDGKIGSVRSFEHGAFWAISGPTHQDQQPFAFSGQWASVFHAGLPTTWNFTWGEHTTW